MTAPKMREDDELIAFFDWVAIAKNQDPRMEAIFHVANERRASFFMGKLLKKKGVKPGVSDVLCMIPTKKFPGLAVELKIKPNKLSGYQNDFGALMIRNGYRFEVAWSAKELIDIVTEYLND